MAPHTKWLHEITIQDSRNRSPSIDINHQNAIGTSTFYINNVALRVYLQDRPDVDVIC